MIRCFSGLRTFNITGKVTDALPGISAPVMYVVGSRGNVKLGCGTMSKAQRIRNMETTRDRSATVYPGPKKRTVWISIMKTLDLLYPGRFATYRHGDQHRKQNDLVLSRLARSYFASTANSPSIRDQEGHRADVSYLTVVRSSANLSGQNRSGS
jgi:hypothetical protein